MLLSTGFATLRSNIKCEHNIQFHFRRWQGENLQVYGLPCGRLPGHSVISLATVGDQWLAAIIFLKKYWCGREESSALYERNLYFIKAIKISFRESLTCTSTANPDNNRKVTHLKCFQPENLFCAAPRPPCFVFCYGRDLPLFSM